ncbi:MAG: S8 family peptidase, partial [Gammaproteobacteria bacterium]
MTYIAPDRPVKSQLNLTNETTGASQIQSSPVGTPGFDGTGITVAVLDSGISANHPDFVRRNSSRVIASVDFTGSTRQGDADGHGTGVAGVVAGSGAASEGYAANYAGVAPGANLIDVRVLDENGVGRTSNVLAALNWVIENKQRYNIRVVNLSMGTPVRESFHTDPLCKAVEVAVRNGIVVVCSAGNLGRTDEIIGTNPDGSPIYRLAYGAISSPANSPYVITVGATDSHDTVRRSDDTVAAFSSKGPTRFDHFVKPDLVAPGRRIVAPMSQEPNPTLANQAPERVVQPTASTAQRNVYFNYSGTSFAAPVVAGTVALMLDANRSLTPLMVKALLTKSAQA